MGKKTTKQNSRFVTVGERAYSFYDAATGINVVRGEKVELTNRQLASTKIKRALATGHLVYTTNDKPVSQYNEATIDKMKENFESMLSQGMTVEKIASAFNLEQISKVAEEYGISVDDGDTVIDVVKAIIIELDSSEKGE